MLKTYLIIILSWNEDPAAAIERLKSNPKVQGALAIQLGERIYHFACLNSDLPSVLEEKESNPCEVEIVPLNGRRLFV